MGTCFYHIRHLVGDAASSPSLMRFYVFRFVVTRPEFSTIAKNRSRAALTASRSLSLDRTLALVHSRPQTHNKRKTHQKRLRARKEERAAPPDGGIFHSPPKLKIFQKRFLISAERMDE